MKKHVSKPGLQRFDQSLIYQWTLQWPLIQIYNAYLKWNHGKHKHELFWIFKLCIDAGWSAFYYHICLNFIHVCNIFAMYYSLAKNLNIWILSLFQYLFVELLFYKWPIWYCDLKHTYILAVLNVLMVCLLQIYCSCRKTSKLHFLSLWNANSLSDYDEGIKYGREGSNPITPDCISSPENI